MKIHRAGLALLGAMAMVSLHAAEPGPDGLLTEELQAFVVTLQKAVQDDSPEKVAPLIQFPLRVNDAPGQSHSVTARRFTAEYRQIFTPDVKAAILRQEPDEIFRNSKGAMLGNGEVWISGVCLDKDCQVAPPKVTAINIMEE